MHNTRGSVALGIKRSIEARGLQQKFVAARAGFTDQQFSDMVNGRKVIRADYVLPIAEAIGVGVSDIYDAGRFDYGEDENANNH